jgi:hypothetical protein
MPAALLTAEVIHLLDLVAEVAQVDVAALAHLMV